MAGITLPSFSVTVGTETISGMLLTGDVFVREVQKDTMEAICDRDVADLLKGMYDQDD